MADVNPALDAAKAAAGSDAQPQQPNADAAGASVGGGKAGSANAPPPQPPPPPTPDSVVELCEMVTLIAVKAFSVSAGVEMTPELEKLCLMTVQEKRQLQTFAPYAMPWIYKILQNLPVVGAAAFGGMYALMLARRFAEIKKRIPPKKKETETGKPVVDTTATVK